MKLLFLVGDTAVGKMTVGQELMKTTSFRLFHNHMTIEPVIEIFGDYERQVVAQLREIIFWEFAASDRRLLNDESRYCCVSLPGEIPFPNYLRLENADISAEDAAKIIKAHFRFQ